MTASPQSRPAVRDLAIDRLRGTLVILMVAGDYLSGIDFVPSWLKHAPDVGLTVADLVAPAFVFVIGLNYGSSFRRHTHDGASSAYRYFGLRYLALIGIGAIISAGAMMVGTASDWGVLQALGVAGLIALPFIRLATWARFAIGTLLLLGYQYVLNTAMLDAVLGSVHGGLFGAVAWGAMLVLSTAIADVWRSGYLRYMICCAVLVAAAAVSTLLVPVSKHRVSLSYVLITLAISAIVFLAFALASRRIMARSGVVSWWGESALALYLIHLLVLAVFVTPPIDWWYAQAAIWLAALQLAVILGSMSIIAWWMHARRNRQHSPLP